jgi:hypothetical protein
MSLPPTISSVLVGRIIAIRNSVAQWWFDSAQANDCASAKCDCVVAALIDAYNLTGRTRRLNGQTQGESKGEKHCALLNERYHLAQKRERYFRATPGAAEPSNLETDLATS